MRVRAAILAMALSAGVAQAGGDQVGVYGYVAKVVPEPNAERPERVQIWGTFSVAAPGPGAEYQAPEHGYLYFAMPTDSPAGSDECRNLRGMIGKLGVVSFGRRGMPVRVRTEDEEPDGPTPYRIGNGVQLLSYEEDRPAVRALGGLPKTRGQVSYGLIDKVVFEPDDAKPERIQIWGIFAMGELHEARFGPPVRGYLYFSLPVRESDHWKALPANQQVVGLRAPLRMTLRVRNPEEKPDSPDTIEYSGTLVRPFAVRPDTEYAPVRSLLAFR